MEIRDFHHNRKDLPDSTPVCLHPHHEDPCQLPCPGCEIDCDPIFTSTLGHARRHVEIDRWLREIGARVIRVEDLGAALEAQHLGRRVVPLASAGIERLPSAGRAVKRMSSVAAHLARLALGNTG